MLSVRGPGHMMSGIVPKWLTRLVQSRHGGITVTAALALPVMLGATGLVIDVNRGYQQRIVNQRAADMGALGAAMAFQNSGSVAVLTPTAKDIATANGLKGASVTATIVNDFPNSGDQSVKVDVSTTVPFTLARAVGAGGNFSVSSEAYATLKSEAPFAAPCFLALSGGKSAITVNGGASISAPDCTVAAIGSIENKGTLIGAHDIVSGSGDISVNWGTLAAETLRFAGSFSAPAYNTNIPPADKRINKPTDLIDPWEDSTELADARNELGAYTTPPTLSNPNTSCSGKDWSFDYSPKAPVNAWRVGSSSTYQVPAGTYCINKFTVNGGITVNFAHGSTLYIDKGVSNGGNSLNFGNANLYVNGGFDTGSSGVTIGDGVLWIGSGSVSFKGTNRKGNGNVIINSSLSMGGGQNLFMGTGNHFFGGLDLSGGGNAIMGNGDFIAVDGVKLAGGSELAVGDGNVTIGTGSGGNAVKLSGSAKFLMGNGRFSANGDIDTAGGSRIAFGATTNHYINGDMKIAGSALFGAGRYTIDGDFNNGTGGTTWPYTSPLNGKTYGDYLQGVNVQGYDMAGVDVTFVLSGTLSLAGGARTKLVAPSTSTSGGQIADMLVHSLTSSNTNWTGGSANNFAGTVYFPNSQIKMSGGNTTLSSGQCFTLIAYEIVASGGAATGSACKTTKDAYGDGGTSTNIRLVV